MGTLKNKIDFVYIFDVFNGNPNGDPDAGNLPRMDAETGLGLVSDVCLKRKVRNYVQVTKGDIKGYDILVKSKELSGTDTFINAEIRKVYEENGIELVSDKDKNKKTAKSEDIPKGRAFMCEKFFDVRTFGAVLSTGPNAGQVRGPIQLVFANSVDPIYPKQHALTVCSARDEDKSYESQVGIQGRKATVPYALYVCYGFVSANLAKQTGFSEEDLNLFFDALKNMFDLDRSAARGLMSAQKLIVFRHDSELGNAPANKLFDLVHIEKTADTAPRSFKDYHVTIDKEHVPTGVTIEELI